MQQTRIMGRIKTFLCFYWRSAAKHCKAQRMCERSLRILKNKFILYTKSLHNHRCCAEWNRWMHGHVQWRQLKLRTESFRRRTDFRRAIDHCQSHQSNELTVWSPLWKTAWRRDPAVNRWPRDVKGLCTCIAPVFTRQPNEIILWFYNGA